MKSVRFPNDGFSRVPKWSIVPDGIHWFSKVARSVGYQTVFNGIPINPLNSVSSKMITSAGCWNNSVLRISKLLIQMGSNKEGSLIQTFSQEKDLRLWTNSHMLVLETTSIRLKCKNFCVQNCNPACCNWHRQSETSPTSRREATHCEFGVWHRRRWPAVCAARLSAACTDPAGQRCRTQSSAHCRAWLTAVPTRAVSTPETAAVLLENENGDVPLVEFMSLVFTPMPGESYHRWLRSLLFLCYVFWVLIHPLVCWFYSKKYFCQDGLHSCSS